MKDTAGTQSAPAATTRSSLVRFDPRKQENCRKIGGFSLYCSFAGHRLLYIYSWPPSKCPGHCNKEFAWMARALSFPCTFIAQFLTAVEIPGDVSHLAPDPAFIRDHYNTMAIVAWIILSAARPQTLSFCSRIPRPPVLQASEPRHGYRYYRGDHCFCVSQAMLDGYLVL